MLSWLREHTAQSDAAERIYVPSATLSFSAASGVNLDIVEHELRKIGRRSPWGDSMLIKIATPPPLNGPSAAPTYAIFTKRPGAVGFERAMFGTTAAFSLLATSVLPIRRHQMQRFEDWISLVARDLRAAQVKNLGEITIGVTYTYIKKGHK